jgi:hypothetical protein
MNTLMPQLRRVTPICLIVCALGCLAPQTKAVVPPPDGGYPGFNTAEGQKALFSLTTGVANTAVGWFSLFSNTDGSFNTALGAGTLLFNVGNQSSGDGTENTAVGAATLLFNTTGFSNTATGTSALLNNTTGSDNTAIGRSALVSNTSGVNNTALGAFALTNLTIGDGNTAVGISAGTTLTTGDRNLYIANQGPNASSESDTIRIGNGQTATFIAGINGADEGSPTAVFINTTTGQLGTAPPSSSRRFKKEIKPMGKTSEAILAFKPVTFQYNDDKKGTPQFGLIAEDVAEASPNLVIRDPNGKPYTVRYDAVNAMLLNEFLKEHHKVEQLEKQVETLSAGLQKVSAQLEVSKAAPQTVLNNR